LILTKPLGTGIISTAVKRGLADEAAARLVSELMAALNRAAAEVMVAQSAHACTDITGFGLLGHLREMAAGSGVDVTINAASVPMLDAALLFAGADVVPGGTVNNLDYVAQHVTFAPGVSRVAQLVLADAQTSGGLLISLSAERSDATLSALRARGVSQASVTGQVTGEGSGQVQVEP
jgi:selenide,water dikinase